MTPASSRGTAVVAPHERRLPAPDPASLLATWGPVWTIWHARPASTLR